MERYKVIDYIGIRFPYMYHILFFMGAIFFIAFVFLLIFRFLDVSISFRNVIRNKRRSALTILAVAAAFSGNVLLGTYFLQMFEGLRETTIRSRTGHIQVMRSDFLLYGSSSPAEYLISDYLDIMNTLQEDVVLKELVNKYMRELRFNGIITATYNQKSLNYIGRGVDIEQDKVISVYDSYVEGSALSDDDNSTVILGKGLANQLNVKAGDLVTLLGTTYDGGLNVLDADVQGIISTFSKEYSNVVVKTSLSYAQEMLALDGINKIILLLNTTGDTSKALARIQQIVRTHPEWDVKAYDWYTLSDFYGKVHDMFSTLFIIVGSLLLGLIIFLVMNTMSMSVYERFSEFGTLRSIGLQKFHLVSLIMTEGAILALFGVVVGVILALGIGNFVSLFNIEVPPPPSMSKGYTLSLRIHLLQFSYIKLLYITAGSLFAVTIISTIVPALQAAKLKIIDALRHV